MPDHQKITAYHEAGHAVLAYEQLGSAAITSLTIVPNSNYLERYLASAVIATHLETLAIFTEWGVFALREKAEAEGDTRYAGFDWNDMDDEGDRLNRQCDLQVEVCLAGHVAEEVFCDVTNDTVTDEDWETAKNFAIRFLRGDEDKAGYFAARWKTVTELLAGKYRNAIETLVEHLLSKKTLTSDQITRIITAELA